MSQFLLCKGGSEKFHCNEFVVRKYPFEEDLLNKATDCFLFNGTKDGIWTVVDSNNLCIDSYFTNAQKHINGNRSFNTTVLYKLFSTILVSADEVVTWYGDYIEDLPVVTDRSEFLKIIECGVKESMCEVFIWYKGKRV